MGIPCLTRICFFLLEHEAESLDCTTHDTSGMSFTKRIQCLIMIIIIIGIF